MVTMKHGIVPWILLLSFLILGVRSQKMLEYSTGYSTSLEGKGESLYGGEGVTFSSSKVQYRHNDLFDPAPGAFTPDYSFRTATIPVTTDNGQIVGSVDCGANGESQGANNDIGFDMVENDDDSGLNSTSSDLTSLASRSRGGCGSGNSVDDCWRCDSSWASHCQSLASCAIGFGKEAIGGRNGRIYVVTSSADNNPANPAPGTLHYAVTRAEPLWIVFAYSMTIWLRQELIVTSYKTIDGRGATVHIAGGAGITLQRVSNVIIHGISIHDIKSTGPGRIMSSTWHVGNQGKADGDAISIFSSKSIWIDHCFLARAADGLVDVIRGSTAVSITNSYFIQHDKVMLLGAHKDDYSDKNMQVTVAYNIFGPGLTQRLPRIRFGTVHIVNNDYSSGWGIYAVGGSEGPTILSQGNIFNPGSGPKEVSKSINDGGNTFGGPSRWNWNSVGDIFQDGSYFSSSRGKWSGQAYSKAISCTARPGSMVYRMTSQAGPLRCQQGSRC